MIIDFSPKPVLFFDGVCNLCNGFVQFVIRHDKKKRFLFAPLQSTAGKEALEHNTTNNTAPDSVILSYRGNYYTRSSAALHTFKLLSGLWPLLFVFIVIPPFIRNAIYNFIARNRYKWFGKKNECMVPTPELAARFITE